MDIQVEDLNALDRSDMDVVKAWFLKQEQSVQSRKDLIYCLVGNPEGSAAEASTENDEDYPEYVLLNAQLDETPLDKFDLFFRLFGLRSCAHEECPCGAVLKSRRMPFYRGVSAKVERTGGDDNNTYKLLNECHVCAQCQAQATLTP